MKISPYLPLLIIVILAVLTACVMDEPNASASDPYLLSMKYIGEVSGEDGWELGEQYQDSNGCYWISFDYEYDEFVQVFVNNSENEAVPYCE